MKKIALFSLILFVYFSAFSQEKLVDSTNRDDYSNYRTASRIRIDRIKVSDGKRDSVLFIIDDHIYERGSAELKKIDFDKFEIDKTINDSTSASRIKTIYLFKRKRS